MTGVKGYQGYIDLKLRFLKIYIVKVQFTVNLMHFWTKDIS